MTGDADGLGEIRKKELIKSGLQLGAGNKDDILVIEDKCVSKAVGIQFVNNDTETFLTPCR